MGWDRSSDAHQAARDARLVRRVKAGDQAAFERLAEQHHGRIRYQSWYHRNTPGVTREELDQAGLVGLYEACFDYDPGSPYQFAAVAATRIHDRIYQACCAARAAKRMILTHAASLNVPHDGDDGEGASLADLIPAPVGHDPAWIVEKREELRERWQARTHELWLAKQRHAYREQTVQAALEWVANGGTYQDAAETVGVTDERVLRWARNAGLTPRSRPRGRPAGHAAEKRERALRLVGDGESLRAAARAVGASPQAVMRWRDRMAA